MLPCSLDPDEVNATFTNIVKQPWAQVNSKNGTVEKGMFDIGPQCLGPLLTEKKRYTHVFIEIE